MNTPVKYEIMLISTLQELFSEDPSQIIIVRSIFEFQILAVFEIRHQGLREASTQILNRGVYFSLHYLLVLLLLRMRLNALPGQLAS